MADKKVEQHYEEFMAVIEKYNLADEKTSEDIAALLTNGDKGVIDPADFAREFGMTEHEAELFLSFVERGLKFKQHVLDKK